MPDAKHPLFLLNAPVTKSVRRTALASIALSAAIFLCLLTYAKIKLPENEVLIASAQSTLAVINFITAVLFYSQFAALRSRQIAAISNGYLFTALIVSIYAIGFGPLFTKSGTPTAASETTAWLYLAWHFGLPICVIFYALASDAAKQASAQRPMAWSITLNVAATCILALLCSWIFSMDKIQLPSLRGDNRFTVLMEVLLGLAAAATAIATLLVLRRRKKSTLDVLLIVVMFSWILDIALTTALNGARFDLGYYAGRVYALLASGFILTVLLIQLGHFQQQLGDVLVEEQTRAASDRERFSRQIRLFGAAVASSDDAIITKDFEGTITGWNEGAKRLFGFSTEEAVGKNINIIVPDDRRNEVRSILARVKQGIAVESHQTVRVTRDGRLLDISLSVSPVKSEEGELIGAAKVARDVTEQRLAEDKFRLAVEASPNGIVMVDATGKILLLNAETERLFGYSREELIGQSIDILVPNRFQHHHKDLRAHYSTGSSARRMGAGRDLHGRRKNGSEFPVEVGLNPIHTRAGILVLSVIVDITEALQAREALLQSEELARGIIETSLDAFVQLDRDGKVIDWNGQAEKIFGLERKEAIGSPFIGKILVDESEGQVGELSNFLKTEESLESGHRFEIVLSRTGGGLIPVEISATRFQRDGYVAFNLFVRDLTKLKDAADQLRQAQKMEALGQLTGGIAHDFNNILTVITGTVELLADGVAGNPQLAAVAKLIDGAATRGTNLTRHMLAFARKQPLAPRDIDVNALIAETTNLLKSTIGENIRIQMKLDGEVWPALADPDQLTTAVLNLALNARDAITGGGEIALQTSNVIFDETEARSMGEDVKAGQYMALSIADTGSGMPPDVLSRVFEPFFTTKGAGAGTGLGLSMVYGFVKQSNGHIDIKSKVGIGTTVTVYLPRSTSQPVNHDNDANTEIEGGHEKILIVEDDDQVREYVISQIGSLGYSTTACSSAEQAIEILRGDNVVDLLFTDVILSGAMNGRQLAEEALTIRSNLKVLYTSGYTRDVLSTHGRLNPDVILLAKPYRRYELAKKLRIALSQR